VLQPILQPVMPSIGTLDLSLISGQQKTALSLANLNFDFALVKVSAPVEYQELGTCLSTKRRQEAEDGPLHGVARKLGALFADEIPATPNLIRAYGQRASEVSANPKLNPKGTKLHGAFADHVGADGTSIWAAATSGSNAIAVHLLACMLARIWSGPEATSIISEIVDARKAILQKRIQGEQFSITEVTAAQIILSRDQIAAWDSSARYIRKILATIK
jgi:hypothetical protein